MKRDILKKLVGQDYLVSLDKKGEDTAEEVLVITSREAGSFQATKKEFKGSGRYSEAIKHVRSL